MDIWPHLLQCLTNHMKSRRSPKWLRKTNRVHVQTDQAGSSTPRNRGHLSRNVDPELSSSEHSPTNAKNSDSESSDSKSSHQFNPAGSKTASRKRSHRWVSPSGEHNHFHTSQLPSSRQHHHRGVSPSGDHPRTPHLPILLALNDTTTQCLARDIYTTGVQTAPPLRILPPVAPLLVEAVAVAGQAAVVVTGAPDTTGRNKLNTENTIIILDGTVSRMIG